MVKMGNSEADRQMVKREYQDERHADYHTRQFEEPYRSTVHLSTFVKSVLGDSVEEPLRAIDIGCGGGANIYHLAKVLPKTEWVGIDWADQFFDLGRPHMAGAKVNCEFIKGDFYQLTKIFGEKSFDLAYSIQTLSWLPGYEDAFLEILRVTRKWAFVTSLFTDYRADIISRVHPYQGPPWDKPAAYFYNVYCYDRFYDFCLAHGASELISQDFVMDIDLPEPEGKAMGTYTKRLEGEKRMQFSGPMHMPWRFIAIRMG